MPADLRQLRRGCARHAWGPVTGRAGKGALNRNHHQNYDGVLSQLSSLSLIIDVRKGGTVTIRGEEVAAAVDETGILLHPPLPSAGVSIAMERGCQQNNRLVDG